jgi:hypothetical protein
MKIMMRAWRLSAEVRWISYREVRQRRLSMFQEQQATANCRSVITALLCAGLLGTFDAGAAAAPIKLAIFDFELEDFSPSASSAEVTSSDAAQLSNVTERVRQLFAQSGRYAVIDVESVEAPAVRARTLRDCNGCDAEIALKLGAEQSLVGVVSRISRTEYVVKFQVRDTRTGAVVAAADSGLRMGADYSWSRGATRLIEDRLLQSRLER